MLKLLCILSVVAIGVLMFFVKRQVKVGLLLLTAMLFSNVEVPFIPFGSNSVLLASVCMIFSELPRLGRYFKLSVHTPVGKLLLLVLAGGLVCCIFSPHLGTFSELKNFFISEYMVKYFALAYSFCLIRHPKDLRPILRILFYGLLIMTFFAIIDLVTGSPIYIKELMKSNAISDERVYDIVAGYSLFINRSYVRSTFYLPHDYGYFCCLVLTLMSFGFKTRLIEKNRYLISVLCCLFGIFSCGCRTVIFCTLIGAICFLLATTSRKEFLRVLSISCISAILLMCLPFVRNTFSKMMTMFSTSSKIEGSSLTMRMDQYSTVLDYVDGQQIFFGKGYNFFNIDMGWGDNDKSLMDSDLKGLEGVMMNLTLERGIFGAFIYIAFYISLLVLIIRYKKYSRKLAALGMTVLTIYLLFANMTGELSSAFPTLIVIGYVLKSGYFVRRYNA